MGDSEVRSRASHGVTTRSPADVLRLAVGVVLLVALGVVGWLFGDAVVGFTDDLLAGLDAFSTSFLTAVVAATRVLALVALVGGVAVTAVREGPRMILTVAAAGIVAAVLVAVLDGVLVADPAEPPVELTDSLGVLTGEGFPTAAGIGAMAAVVSAAAPWLSRGWRRIGWIAVVGLVLARFLTAPLDFDSVSSAVLGWTVGSAALVVLGAPSRRPSAEAIKDGLAACGLDLAELEPASVDARGSTPYFGRGHDGQRYFVKAVGEDERSADLLFRIYRWIQRDDLGDERPFSSLRRAVEHEAFVSMSARGRGILTPEVVAFASTEPTAYVLAYRAVAGKSLDSVPVEQVTDEVLDQVWGHIVELRAVRIAHRDLRLANVFLGDDGRIWMIDFGFSEVAASDLLLATDVAELIASSSTVVGTERAVARAEAAVGAEAVRAALERLRYPTLSGATRTTLKSRPGALDELRARVGAS